MRQFNRHLRKLLLIIGVALLLVVVACARIPAVSVASGSPAVWAFQWPDGVPASIALPQAVLANGHAQNLHGDLLPPVSIQWLVTQPTFGVALIQLDATNQWMSLVYFQAATTWTIAGEITLMRPTAQTGSRADQALPLPHDLYVGQDRVQTYASPFTLRLWLSPTRTFAFGYVHESSHALSPTAQTVTIEGYRGWLSPGADFAGVVLPMGHETMIFGGSADSSLVEYLAGESVTHWAMLTKS